LGSLLCSPLFFFSVFFLYIIFPPFLHILRSVFIVPESLRVWETKFQSNSFFFFWSLNLIKNQILNRITIIILNIGIILKIRIEWQKHIVVPNFHVSWQITLFIEINLWYFNFTF
jgi:hypothetical protein